MRLVEFFTVLDESSLVSPSAAAKFIAKDDDLFEAIAAWASYGGVDSFDEREDQLKKLLYILSRVKPFKYRLYRGEPTFEHNNYQPYETRGFSSWTPNYDTASKYFADHPSLTVKYTDGPVQAVKLEDIAYWRTVLTGESHYGSAQAEYFVLEPVERKEIGMEEYDDQEAKRAVDSRNNQLPLGEPDQPNDPFHTGNASPRMESRVVLESKAGTFVGAKLTPETETRLLNWLERAGVENATPREDLHVTVVGHKTKEFPWTPKQFQPLEIDPETVSLDIFGDDKDTLVLRFDSPELEERHKWARDTFDIDWDYDEYKPHITLGKDTGVSPKDIPKPNFTLFIDKEYSQAWDD